MVRKTYTLHDLVVLSLSTDDWQIQGANGQAGTKFVAHIHPSRRKNPIDYGDCASFSLALPLGNLTFQQNTDSFVGKAFVVFQGGREANIDDIQSVSEMPHLYLTTRNIFRVCINAPNGFDFEDPILFTAQPWS